MSFMFFLMADARICARNLYSLLFIFMEKIDKVLLGFAEWKDFL